MRSSRRRFPIQIPLRDILALVVGYGMAALLFRAFWPASIPAVLLGLPMLALHVWLGLAMSGPIILLRDGARTDHSSEGRHGRGTIASRSWAEAAWILIGIYWIVLGLFVIPARLHDFQLRDAVLVWRGSGFGGAVVPVSGAKPVGRKIWVEVMDSSCGRFASGHLADCLGVSHRSGEVAPIRRSNGLYVPSAVAFPFDSSGGTQSPVIPACCLSQPIHCSSSRRAAWSRAIVL